MNIHIKRESFTLEGFTLGMGVVTLIMEEIGTKNTVYFLHGSIAVFYVFLYLKKRKRLLHRHREWVV